MPCRWPLTAWLLPGMSISAAEGAPAGLIAVSAAFLLAIINLLIRPVILLIARPLGWIALFIVGFLVNAIAIWLTAWLLPGFNADFLSAIVGGIVFGFFNAIFTGILELDEEGSFYQNRIERRAKDQPFDSAGEPGRGLMMLEIDGLSYWVIQDALQQGLLPTLQQMIDEDGYELTKVDCGLPSMTSACQAGIMFGDNSDIPAYRWYDKEQGQAVRLEQRCGGAERALWARPGTDAAWFQRHEHAQRRCREVHVYHVKHEDRLGRRAEAAGGRT